MANYHVMEICDDKDVAKIAWHIAVPDEDNYAGVNLRTALGQYLTSAAGGERTITQVPWLEADNPTEYASLSGCEVYEIIQTVEYNANDGNAAKAAAMDEHWTQLNSTIPDTLRERLKFWGLNRDVS